MNELRLSIILPSYNVEREIEKNIKSLMKIEIEKCEFLYINDGSTDSTRDIIEKYQKQDARIHLIDKTNAGLGAARNTGLDECHGRYLYFVDSDDTVNAEEIEKSLQIAESNNLDILKGRHRNVDQNGNVLYEPEKDPHELTEKIWTGSEWLLGPQIYDIVCADMYRTVYLRENNLRFEEGVLHEDVDFVIKVLYFAKRIMLSGLCVYNYFMRTDSIMHSSTPRHYQDAYLAALRTEKFMAYCVLDEKVRYGAFYPYLQELYYAIPHLAIQNGIELKYIMRDSDLRNNILKWIKHSKLLKVEIQYIAIKLRCYGLYSIFYKIYNYKRIKY